MTDSYSYDHADNAEADGIIFWPDEGQQLLPQNISPLTGANAWFDPYMDAHPETGLSSAEADSTSINPWDFQRFNMEGVNTPRYQDYQAYPYGNGEMAFRDGNWLNGNGVNEQPIHHTANNVHIPPQTPAEVPSRSVGVTPSEVRANTPPCPANTDATISPRPFRYTCNSCSFSSNIKRDYERHLNTRKHQSNATSSIIDLGDTEKPPSNTTGWFCPVQDCRFHAANGDMMFSREDNLWRQIKKVHNTLRRGRT